MAAMRKAEAPLEEPLLATSSRPSLENGNGVNDIHHEHADVPNGDVAASFRWGSPNPDRQQEITDADLDRLDDLNGASPSGSGRPPLDEETLRALHRELNYMKVLYFLGNLGTACWGRFAQVYYLQKGLGPASIGVLEGVMPLVQFVTQPFWGWLADVTENKKMVFLVTKIMNTVLLLLFSVPWLAKGFWPLFMISTSMSCFVAMGVIDAYVLDITHRLGENVYGQVRLWGAASWGLGAFAMGIINDRWGFEYNFILYGSLSVAAIILAAWKIPNPPKRRTTDPSNDTKEIVSLLMGWTSVAFFTEMLVVGMGVGVVESLLFIYILTDLGGSASLCGTVVLVTVLFELPIFHYAHQIIARIGHAGCLSIAYFCYFVRVWGYTLLTPATRHWILALEVMHGFTFALLYSAAVEYARLHFPPKWASLVQSLLNVTYYNLGLGLGALGGGYVMQHYGARVMYRGFGAAICLLFVARIVSLIATSCCKKRRPEAFPPAIIAC